MMLNASLAMSALGAVLCLDDNIVLRIMLAQPIACGSLLGLFMGDLRLGVTVGAVLQLLWLFDIPAGGFITIDYTSCTVIVTALLFISLWSGMPRSGALMIGFPVYLILGTAAGAVSSLLTRLLRRFNEAFAERATQGIANGRFSSVSWNNLLAIVPMFVKHLGLIFLTILFGWLVLLPPLIRLSAHLDCAGSNAFIAGPLIAAGVGIGLRSTRAHGSFLFSGCSMALAFLMVKYAGLQGRGLLGLVLCCCLALTLIWRKVAAR
ncbi:PTS sugar transporter subunit IIC [bacterium]|nr:PTS sugar transporter subunit IIC [bacterium]